MHRGPRSRRRSWRSRQHVRPWASPSERPLPTVTGHRRSCRPRRSRGRTGLASCSPGRAPSSTWAKAGRPKCCNRRRTWTRRRPAGHGRRCGSLHPSVSGPARCTWPSRRMASRLWIASRPASRPATSRSRAGTSAPNGPRCSIRTRPSAWPRPRPGPMTIGMRHQVLPPREGARGSPGLGLCRGGRYRRGRWLRTVRDGQSHRAWTGAR